MATATLPSRTNVRPMNTVYDATPQEIIASARSAPAPARGAFALASVTAGLMWAAFTPVDYGPLAWICLVPLLSLARLERPTRWMYRVTYLGGLFFWLASLQWMRLGDALMYPMWGLLSVYLAFYFPLFLGLARVAVWKLRVPLVIAAPIVWTGLELARNHFLTGYGWYALAHSQYRWIELIQISDLVGTYGVTFLIVLTNASLSELLPAKLFSIFKLLPASQDTSELPRLALFASGWRIALCLCLFVTTLVYGYVRRGQANFQPGPLVALVQGNVTSEVKHDPQDWPRIQQQHEKLTGQVLRQAAPDLIVWPETMFRWPLFETTLNATDDDLQQAHPRYDIAGIRAQDRGTRKKLNTLSQMTGAALLIGIETIETDRDRLRTFNSAAFIRPDLGIVGRYDKLHRVMFGEYIPFADELPWLGKFSPFGADFGIAAGQAAVAFDYKGIRFAPIICFEDTVPHVVRGILNATSRPDVLVNLTNDGWFHGSSELDQHLITAAFRSVEYRVPMVRAVNTGISAIIDGDGAIRQRAVDPATGKSKQVEATVIGTVPLDRRTSIYLKTGDWFAGTCFVCCALLAVTAIVHRPRVFSKSRGV